MPTFDVYVDGATEPSADAVKRLAEVMAQRYGLTAADLVARLAKGRFRVKANVDQATAATYKQDLEAIGARVTLAESRGGASLPPPNRPAVPPPRPGPSMPPRTTGPSQPPGNQQYQSGLSAAFHEDTPIPDFGGLDKANAALAAVDGGVEKSPEAPVALPASIGPATAAKQPAAKRPDKPTDTPLDLFAPPDQQGEETKFELAADEVAHQQEKRKKLATPPAGVAVTEAAPERQSQQLRPKVATPVGGVAIGGTVAPSAADTPRWRYAGGVLVAVLLGFLPAHCVAMVRERGYGDIDAEVIAAETTEPATKIDAIRDDRYADKKSKRTNIALVSLLIWAAAGAGIGYVWFRKVPWDKVKFGQNWP
jgi:hypothetical protein